MKILVTGFDPFGGETINPAWEAVRRLPEKIGEAEVVRIMIPTVFTRSFEQVLEKVSLLRPDYVVSVGQAAGRSEITPERIAINLEDAAIPDNDGVMPQERPVIPGAPDGYFSLLPVARMAQAIKDAGLPAKVSNTAGTFVCNHVMYALLHACHTRFTGMKSGFIHVPCVPEQTVLHPEWFSLPVEEITRGLTAALCVLVG